MTFRDIRDGVQQVVRFILPPLFNLFLFVTLTYYIAPGLLPKALEALPWINSAALEDQEIYGTLKSLGLTKLIPIFAAVGVIFLLYSLQGLVLALGHVLPGSVVVFPERRFVHSAGVDKLVRYMARSSISEDPRAMVGSLLGRFERFKAGAKTNYKYWNETSAKYARRLNTSKVFILWTLLLPFLARHFGVPGRGSAAALFGMIFCLVAVYSVGKLIYAYEQAGFAQKKAIELTFHAETTVPPDAERLTEFRKRLLDCWPEDERWWEFRLIDWTFVRWVSRTFMKTRKSRLR
jgi:hypothetical protein